MIRNWVLALVATLALTGAAGAETAATKPADTTKQAATATTKQVDIESNEMEIFDKEKKAIFRGNVDAKRADVSLKCNELVVKYDEVKQPDGTTKTDATDLDAKGNVLIKTAKETITGDWAKFNPQTNKLVVGGKVKLVQGSTVLQGNELHADLNTDKVEMKGGRVKGSFLPK
ncbi:MAG TPA: LptA/OstA family protein [Aestuariivirga sp.]|nr:hypothetical protein [Alphaproteobacteria bacterium]HRX36843.1 LptA/OstA family protein [Aestuariivirga sp.]